MVAHLAVAVALAVNEYNIYLGLINWNISFKITQLYTVWYYTWYLIRFFLQEIELNLYWDTITQNQILHHIEPYIQI